MAHIDERKYAAACIWGYYTNGDLRDTSATLEPSLCRIFHLCSTQSIYSGTIPPPSQ